MVFNEKFFNECYEHSTIPPKGNLCKPSVNYFAKLMNPAQI